MQFREQLEGASQHNQSHLCVGLDPVTERISGGDVLAWCRSIIEATADLVCCFKPNSAFFEALGTEAWDCLRAVIASVPSGIPVLLDAKRGDVGSTAEAYARAAFDVLGAGAVTVSPYLGRDAIDPFLAYSGHAVFVLCRTSNPGAGEFQDLIVDSNGASRPLFEVVAQRARLWNQDGNVGLVTGATYPQEIARVRSICPEQTLLVPGVGTQGGDLGEAVEAARDAQGSGFLVNVSRKVTYASDGADFALAARRAAERLRAGIELAARGAGQGASAL